MKILFICPYLPYPLISGGHTRVFNVIKHLSGSNQIHLLAYNREPVTREQEYELKKYCANLTTIPRPPVFSPGNLAAYLTTGKPFMHVINGRNQALVQTIDRETAGWQPDLIHVEHYHMADCLLRSRSSKLYPKVIGEQGVEYLILERLSQVEKNPVKKLAAMQEARRIKPFEIGICNQFDGCIEVSQEDKDLIAQAGVKIPVHVVINGVDTGYFSSIANEVTEPAILFVGTFKFFGNQDAVKWMLKDIWPQVKTRHPNARFYIAGNQPPAWLRQVHDPAVEVMGWVDNLAGIMQKCRVVVAPLRMGSGTKLKILEAMSMGKPVVTTSIGSEGIGAVDGRELLVRDDPRQFAEAVADCLNDPDLAGRLGGNSRKLVQNNYSWETSAGQLTQAYQETIKTFRKPTP
ncbi:MAG: glycosyltransferase family 4 protein [bacterium]|nr:glycosyltransferase family 4 protein [bacterium]